ncbi:MAG: spondin domain-containing protein, partial [Bacteroidota bacterium]
HFYGFGFAGVKQRTIEMRSSVAGVCVLSTLSLGTLSCDPETLEPAASATFTVTLENVSTAKSFITSGVFDTPVGATAAGAAGPGGSFSFTFHAGKGSYLSFATMFVQSNDLFYAVGEGGIPLYDTNGDPISGDMTGDVDLWDAGTEVNEAPFVGANQPPRQGGADTGEEENGVVQLVDDGFTYPADEEVIQLMITPGDNNSFTVTLNNVSTGDNETPLAPGVFVIHGANQTPLYKAGIADTGLGLEGLAEDGAVAGLGDNLAADAGYTSPFAPGIYAVHTEGSMPLYSANSPDLGEGLEAVAEDGSPDALNTALSSKMSVSASGIFNMPVGASAAAPIGPGESYSFFFEAEEGSALSLASMLIQTNDLFYGFGEGGLSLFANGIPVSGDLTSSISLWDAGTEVNEFPGAGDNQAPRQSGANTGPDEGGNVEIVNDGFTYPDVADFIRVTITSESN